MTLPAKQVEHKPDFKNNVQLTVQQFFHKKTKTLLTYIP